MPLTPENIHAAAIAAYENARDLLEEAKLLFDNGHCARTLFLSCIAEEELGKALMCVGAIAEIRLGNFDSKSFFRLFRRHKSKTNMVMGFEDANLFRQSVADSADARLQASESIDAIKMSSLYADFYEDRPATPRQQITEAFAKTTLYLANQRLKVFEAKVQPVLAVILSRSLDDVKKIIEEIKELE